MTHVGHLMIYRVIAWGGTAGPGGAGGNNNVKNNAGAEVWVDGRPVGFSPLDQEVFVEPGTRHSVEAKLAGYEAAQQSAELVKGEFLRVTLTMVKKDVAAALPPALAPPTASGSGSGSGRESRPLPTDGTTHPIGGNRPPSRSVLPGVIAGALGLAATGAGVALLVASSGKEEDANDLNKTILDVGGYCLATNGPFAAQCNQLHATTKDAARLHDAGVGVLVGGGIAVLAAGAYFLWPSLGGARSSGVRATPVVTLTGGGMVVQGAF
jgi:hypothetical protein